MHPQSTNSPSLCAYCNTPLNIKTGQKRRYCCARCYHADKSKKAAESFAERFWARVDKSGECWVWLGLRNQSGYGHVQHLGRHTTAHRISYELNFGVIPDGMWVLHRCDNPPCVNPDHLFLGDRLDNTRDMVEKDRQQRGDRHWTRLHPERRATGSRHGSVTHPDSRPVGTDNHMSRLTEDQVRFIRTRTDIPGYKLAEMFGVSNATISRVRTRQLWRHVD